MSKSGHSPFFMRAPSNQKKCKKVGVSGSNVNVKENENEKEKESKYAGDIKKEKIFYARAIAQMIFSMFLMAEKIENFFLS